MDKNFKGIWIPACIWLDKELSIMEKVFLIEINSLDDINGCYAGNSHFKEYSGLSKSRCSTIINILKDKGYVDIQITYKPDKKTVEKRVIKVNKKIKAIIKSNSQAGSDKKSEVEPIKETAQDIEQESELEKVKECNDMKIIECEISEVELECEANIKKKDEDISRGIVEKPSPIYKSVIEYLNKAASSRFNYKSTKNQRIINARLREGYSFEDFTNVIDMKCEQWLSSHMNKYLKPDTLFSGKFDKYVNEVNSIKSNKIGGQSYGKQFKNAGNYRANQGDFQEERSRKLLEGCDNTSRFLSEEDREWAAKELF